MSRLNLTAYQIFSIDGPTPVELYNALKDQQDREEQGHKTQWETMRTQTITIVNMFVEPKDRIRDPVMFMRFPWDEREQQSLAKQKEYLTMILGPPKKKKENLNG